MRTGTRLAKVASLALLLAPALATVTVARQAQAQEIQLTGPLAGAPAVRHERLYREGRFELAPTVSFTLLDEYNRTIFFGARAQYNITDWISAGVWGAFGAIQSPTNLSNEIASTSTPEAQTAVNIPPKGNNCGPNGNQTCTFTNQVAQMQWILVPQVQVTPFRGKLAIFQKLFVNADAYLHLGAGFVGLQERPDCGAPGQNLCTDPKSFGLASRLAVAPTFGLGFNFYIGDFMSFGVEYRALPFSWNRSGFDTSGGPPNGNFPDNKVDSNDQTFKFNQMMTLSFGFSLPFHPKISE
jgi:outer membrane beta-barrel protein